MRYWTILLFFTFAKVLCVPQPIVGGRDAPENTFGYQVSLCYPREGINSRPFHFCGGSIISNYHVLTAAHCSNAGKKPGRSIEKILVLVGTNRLNFDDLNPDYVYKVKSFVDHEEYSRKFLFNDISLITLTTRITFVRNAVWPIRLAHVRPKDGAVATVTGFGYTDPDVKKTSKIMQYTKLKVLNLQECMDLNPLDYRYPNENVTQANICLIGDVGQSTCSGDSGGPAVWNNEQIGLVSFGSDRCGSGMPTAFTCVTDYITWIQDHCGLTL